jgi:hypothetical protein
MRATAYALMYEELIGTPIKSNSYSDSCDRKTTSIQEKPSRLYN